MKLHVPSLVVGAVAAVVAGVLSAQQIAPELIRGPVKVLGVPAPYEWIDIESNAVGQVATTFVVPEKHHLTLFSVRYNPHNPKSLFGDKMKLRFSIDGAWHWDQDLTDSDVLDGKLAEAAGRAGFGSSTVLEPGQTLLFERYDPGDTVDTTWADDSATGFIRGYLERFEK